MPHFSIKSLIHRVTSLWRQDAEPRPKQSGAETPLWGTAHSRSYYQVEDDPKLDARLRRQGAMVWGDHGIATMRDQNPEALANPTSSTLSQGDPRPSIPVRRSSLTHASRIFRFPRPPPRPEPINLPEPVAQGARTKTVKSLRLSEIVRNRAKASTAIAQGDDRQQSTFSDAFEWDDMEMQQMTQTPEQRPSPSRSIQEPFDVRLEAAVLRAIRPFAPRRDLPRSCSSLEWEAADRANADDATSDHSGREIRFTGSDWLDRPSPGSSAANSSPAHAR